MSWYQEWRPYVPVAQRRAKAATYAAKLAKKEGRELSPVTIEGRTIATSFWGRAWCDNLESYSDYENRLPRGRSYVRNGSVIDLQIQRGEIKAIVSGSEIYQVKVSIKTLPPATWRRLKQDCARSIDSLMDLLRGRFDDGVMRRLSQPKDGLFPQPSEIQMSCSCPDWAGLCKHVAAVLYGVGARLDSDPEMLFTLRDVDHLELIGQAVDADNLDRTLKTGQDGSLAGVDLGAMFGIDLDGADDASKKSSRQLPARPKSKVKSKPTARVRTVTTAGARTKPPKKPIAKIASAKRSKSNATTTSATRKKPPSRSGKS